MKNDKSERGMKAQVQPENHMRLQRHEIRKQYRRVGQYEKREIHIKKVHRKLYVQHILI